MAHTKNQSEERTESRRIDIEMKRLLVFCWVWVLSFFSLRIVIQTFAHWGGPRKMYCQFSTPENCPQSSAKLASHNEPNNVVLFLPILLWGKNAVETSSPPFVASSFKWNGWKFPEDHQPLTYEGGIKLKYSVREERSRMWNNANGMEPSTELLFPWSRGVVDMGGSRTIVWGLGMHYPTKELLNRI